MRRSNYYGFRRFGFRRSGRFNRRRYWNNRRRRFPLYRSIRTVSNRGLVKLAFGYDLVVGNPLAVNRTRLFAEVDWSQISASADFIQYNQLYSTFIPIYFKMRWVPNIQSNASGYYLPGGVPPDNSPVTYNLYDGYSTTRYDNVDDPISPNDAVQYNSFKTFNAARRWQTIVYPRKSQMTAPRQQFSAYVGAPPITDTIRGMGRLWLQIDVSWEDSNNNMAANPPVNVPSVAVQSTRAQQLGHFYAFFYMRVYDRK